MIRNKRLSEDEFFKERKEVLAQWPTGKDCDLEEAIAYHKTLPPHKNFVNMLKRARDQEEIYASSGMGKATVEEQIDLLQYTEKEGLADILGISPDSFTRQLDFDRSQKGWEESKATGKSVLNGLPVVNIGVAGIRKIVESVNCPIHPRYGAADARLCDEILLAGGCSTTAADAFMDFWQHSAKASLEKTIGTHQYVSRLMAYYEEHGVPTCTAAQGLYAAGIPPSLQTANIILSSVLQVEQGIKNVSVKCTGHGNLVQDTASSIARIDVLKEYLKKLGYNDVTIWPNLSFNLMQYPAELGVNFGVVFMNTLMTKLAKCYVSDIRTVAEAKAIPTKEDNAVTFRTAKAMQNYLQKQKIGIESKYFDPEYEMEAKEIRLIMDKVLEMGDGDALVGAARAVETGVIDNPFAANRAAAGKVLGIKDAEGAFRYYQTGNLPFTKEIIEYHQEKIAEREKLQGRKIDYETVVNDLLAISQGRIL